MAYLRLKWPILGKKWRILAEIGLKWRILPENRQKMAEKMQKFQRRVSAKFSTAEVGFGLPSPLGIPKHTQAQYS